MHPIKIIELIALYEFMSKQKSKEDKARAQRLLELIRNDCDGIKQVRQEMM